LAILNRIRIAMKVKRLGIPHFHTTNKKFNNATSPLVGEIFQTNSPGPIGYLTIGRFNPKPAGRYAPPPQKGTVENEQTPPPTQVKRFDMHLLSEYERVVFSCLVWGEYPTYVLTGEMGSGKTTTASYIMEMLKRPRNSVCEHCTQAGRNNCTGPIIISIDFNEGFGSSNARNVMNVFKKLLYSRLKAELRQLLKKDSLVDTFLQFIQRRENINRYSVFDDFAQRCEESDWQDETEASKANSLFNYIANNSEDRDEQLRLLMLLARFLRSTIRPDHACFVLLLDNIDVVSPEAQFDLLLEILNLQQLSSIKSLVPMRRSTFERLNNQSAYSFGIINHSGPRAMDIVKSRINHYLTTWNEDPRVKALESQHSEALYRRLQYLAVEFTRKNSALEKVFWLSGASLRQALFMFERVVINSVIEYDKDPHYRDELLRAALHGDNPDQEISNTDRFIVNVFSDPSTQEFSLICIRILQFVAEFSDRPNYRTIRNLVATLSGINSLWTSKITQAAINHLLNIKRPLLWVDGKSYYNNPTQMLDCNDRLYLTEAGGHYLSRTSTDLEYFQEASVSIEWKRTANLPESHNYTSLVERFSLVRLCLKAVMNQDCEETIRFRKWVEDNQDYPEVDMQLFSNRMLLR
jgi:hypothetical protein